MDSGVNDLADLRRRLAKPLADHAHARAALASERNFLASLSAKRGVRLRARDAVQAVAETIQASAHEQIARVVTRCIRDVGWDYDFKINFKRKRGKTEAEMVFLRNGHPVDPVSAAGGGVVDVAALALRVACLVLATPKRRQALILDEPFKGVNGEEYRRRAASVVETLSREMGIQIIIATGLDWLRVGKVVEIGIRPDAVLSPQGGAGKTAKTTRAGNRLPKGGGRAEGRRVRPSREHVSDGVHETVPRRRRD